MKRDYSNCVFLDKYPGYAISPEGRVFSTKSGQEVLSMVQIKKPDGRIQGTKVYRLIAEAFVPNPNGHRNVAHLDEDTANNTPANLQWKNNEHRLMKLSEDKVKIIYSLLSKGESPAAIATHFSVATATVFAIKHGRIWKHLYHLYKDGSTTRT